MEFEITNSHCSNYYKTNTQEISYLKRMQNSFNLRGHRGCVNCLRWSFDGRLLLSGSDDTSIKLWDMTRSPRLDEEGRSENLVATLRGHSSNVFAVDFLPSHFESSAPCRVLSGSNDADCRVYDLATEKCLNVITQFQRKVYGLSVPRTCSDTFLACSADGTVRGYDVREPTRGRSELDGSLRQGSYSVMPQFLGGGPIMPAAEKSRDNLLVDFSRELRYSEVLSVEHHPLNANVFIASVLHGKVYMFDLRCIKKSIKDALNVYYNDHIANPVLSSPTAARFSPNGSEILVSCINDGMYLYNSNTPRTRLSDLYNRTFIEKDLLQKSSRPKSKLALLEEEPADETTAVRSVSADDTSCFDGRSAENGYLPCENTDMRDERGVSAERPPFEVWGSPGDENVEVSLRVVRGQVNQMRNIVIQMSSVDQTDRIIDYISQYQDLIASRFLMLDRSRPEENIADSSSSCSFKAQYRGHAHQETIKSASFYGEQYVMTGSDDGKVYVYEKASGNMVTILDSGGDIVNVVERSPALPTIACCGLDNWVQIWQPDSPLGDIKLKCEANERRVNQINSRYAG